MTGCETALYGSLSFVASSPPQLLPITTSSDGRGFLHVKWSSLTGKRVHMQESSVIEGSDHYEQLFHKLVKSRLEEPVSGLLLIYPSFLIHIIESTSEILNAILQDLVQMQKPNGKCLLLNSRILVMSHNVPCRLFTQWYFRVIIWPVIYLHDAAEGQPVMTLVEDCLTLLMKLAVYLSEILQPGNNGPGENLYELVPNLLVREEIVCALIQSNELLTPEQYLRMYQGPLNSANDSGEAWTIVQDHFL
ncbi:testis-expressed protein 47-like [Rhinophrynus dorsalis]